MWPQKLWQPTSIIAISATPAAYGIGYTAPAALGAALANKGTGRITVSIQGDGDLMCCPGVAVDCRA